MTNDDFKSWVDYHEALFGGFKTWYARLQPVAIQVWAEALEGVTLKSAKAASKAMAIGDLPAPQGFTKHLPTIRERARALDFESTPPKVDYLDGERVYQCGDCADSGYVEIYRPEVVELVMEDSLHESDAVMTCMAVCGCPRGNGRHGVRYSRHARYGSAYMIRAAALCEARSDGDQRSCRDRQVDEIRQQLDECINRRRTATFDKWNVTP